MSRLASPPVLNTQNAMKVITELRKKRGHFGTKFIKILDPSGKKIKIYLEKIDSAVTTIRSSIDTINYCADNYYQNPNDRTEKKQAIHIEQVYIIVPLGNPLPKWIDFNLWFKTPDTLVNAIKIHTKSHYSPDRELYKQIEELSQTAENMAKPYQEYRSKLIADNHFTKPR